jgi:hypothetical protein
MNARVCKRLRLAVWGPEGEQGRQHFIMTPRVSKSGRPIIAADDTRRRYQSFKHAYLSFPWNQRHTAFTVRKSV